MLRRKKPPEDEFAIEAFHTLVGSKTSIEGRISFSDGIRVDGRVTGDIQVERGAMGSIAVGPEAEVRGNITAHRVLVAGTVHGNIRALETVHLLPTARVTGDVSYAKLSIRSGAVVKGVLSDLAKSEDAAAEPPGKLIRLADKVSDTGSAPGSSA
jgi:cytoskeletal protein CcmA (bactofilin family)